MSSEIEPSRPGRTVLCVEDVESSAALVDRTLRRLADLEVVVARTGSAARSLCATTRWDLVITDLNLPDVSGAEWVRELMRMPLLVGVPIVVVSADATPPTIDAIMAAGASSYLTKPIDLRQLTDVVELLAPGDDARPDPHEPPPGRFVPSGELIDRFLAESTIELSRIHDAVRAHDHDELERLSHRLRGGALVFGAADMATALDRLESTTRDEQVDDVHTCVDEVDGAFARFRLASAPSRRPAAVTGRTGVVP